MSKGIVPNSPMAPIGPMYIVDFLQHVGNINLLSRDVIVAAIRAAQLYGPAIVSGQKIADGVFYFDLHAGFGSYARIEIERDRDGLFQPVFGEIL